MYNIKIYKLYDIMYYTTSLLSFHFNVYIKIMKRKL